MSNKRQSIRKFYNWNLIYNNLRELGINTFKWVNMPKEINTLYLEKILFEQGYCFFFRDDVTGEYITLGGTMGGMDIYGIPTERTAIGMNNFIYEGLNKTNSVIIYNTFRGLNTLNYARLYADKIANCDLSRDINLRQLRFPYLFIGDISQQLSLKNIYEKIEDGEVAIFSDKNIKANELTCINTNVPYVCDKLTEVKANLYNEYLTLLGIENTNMNKKERMVSNEVNGNYGNIEINRATRLSPRQYAAEQINDLFNLDVKVEFNSDLLTILNKSELFEQIEESKIITENKEVVNNE